MLPTPSKEQRSIVNAIKTKNVKVNAVAGSGKTTTICMMAKEIKENFLLLTYNKRLKSETKYRVAQNGLQNIHVHNYHSFCFNKYLVHGTTDQMIVDTLEKYKPGNKCSLIEFNYHTIVIDEAQDLTPLYVKLIKLIISHNVRRPKMCIIGDARQTIYGFNGADSRFLEHSDAIFNINNKPWIELTLSTSYRLSISMANFLNNCILHDDIIVGNSKKKGFKPRYLFCNSFSNAIVKELLNFYIAKGYQYKDIFVLAPSIQSDLSPIKTFANTLSEYHGVPIFMPTSDGEKLDNNNIKNKLVFATFHQVKGLERKCTIIFGFDNSYYYYYNPDADKSVCPNEIYVGLTRCTERMTIIHHYKRNFINFINNDIIPEMCYTEKLSAIGLEAFVFNKNNVDMNNRVFELAIDDKRGIDIIMENNDYNNSLNKNVKLSVTKLLSHLPIEVINKALNFINITQIKNTFYENNKIKSPFDSDEAPGTFVTESIPNDKFLLSYIVNDMFHENVSEIIGTALPIYYEYVKYRELPIKKYIEEEIAMKPYSTNKIYAGIKKKYDRIKNLQKIKSSDIFELVTIHLALSNNLIHKLNQIKDFKLIDKERLKECVTRLNNHLNTKTRPTFEAFRSTDVSIHIDGYDVPVQRTINGYIDCIDADTVWEFKMVQNINSTHYLQLAIYAYLYYMNMETGKTFKILNINDGSKYLLEGSIDDFKMVFEYIYKYKFAKPVYIDDVTFINLYAI